MTFEIPCRREGNDPDDWFIGRDGKQYADEPATEDEIREALIRRRKAKDACFVDCILREHCLDAGLEMPHGTWGGYYEEERREIVKLRNQRRTERAMAGGDG